VQFCAYSALADVLGCSLDTGTQGDCSSSSSSSRKAVEAEVQLCAARLAAGWCRVAVEAAALRVGDGRSAAVADAKRQCATHNRAADMHGAGRGTGWVFCYSVHIAAGLSNSPVCVLFPPCRLRQLVRTT
jgi:hypothetical protein